MFGMPRCAFMPPKANSKAGTVEVAPAAVRLSNGVSVLPISLIVTHRTSFLNSMQKSTGYSWYQVFILKSSECLTKPCFENASFFHRYACGRSRARAHTHTHACIHTHHTHTHKHTQFKKKRSHTGIWKPNVKNMFTK